MADKKEQHLYEFPQNNMLLLDYKNATIALTNSFKKVSNLYKTLFNKLSLEY